MDRCVSCGAALVEVPAGGFQCPPCVANLVPLFEKEPDYPAPLPSDLVARFNGAVVIPFNFVPKEAPVADAITITPAEPTSSKKAIVAKGASAVVALAVLAQVLLPSGLWDTLSAAVEFIARQFAG